MSGRTHHVEWCESEGLIHDQGTADAIRQIVSKGDTAIDVGAHIGSLTKVMLDQGAKVHAFEPNYDSFQCLKHNCPAAFSYNLALSDEIGIRPFYCDPYNAGASRFYERTLDAILAVTLDSLRLPSVDFLKIDCEGAELRVLRGGRITINRDKPAMMIEVNRQALIQQHFTPEQLFIWLTEQDYVFTILQDNCSLHDPQYDIIARPK